MWGMAGVPGYDAGPFVRDGYKWTARTTALHPDGESQQRPPQGETPREGDPSQQQTPPPRPQDNTPPPGHRERKEGYSSARGRRVGEVGGGRLGRDHKDGTTRTTGRAAPTTPAPPTEENGEGGKGCKKRGEEEHRVSHSVVHSACCDRGPGDGSTGTTRWAIPPLCIPLQCR